MRYRSHSSGVLGPHASDAVQLAAIAAKSSSEYGAGWFASTALISRWVTR
jgi:hypothetical protein